MMSKFDLLVNAAINWINKNPDKKPEFSSACGMTFNDNDAADDFDSDMGEYAYKNGITLHGSRVPDLYFIAIEADKVRKGEL